MVREEASEELTSVSGPEVRVLLSGGLDSACCLSFYKNAGRPTDAAFIDFGQSARYKEFEAAKSLAAHYQVRLNRFDWTAGSMKLAGEVLGRNAFFLFGALMEAPSSVTGIAIGIHAGTGYADCSPAFVEEMQRVVDLYSGGRISVLAPFVDWSKPDIWAYAKSQSAPIPLTYSCETGGDAPCGVCLSCKDREKLNAL
ncbi:MAG: tRNA methyl transferase-like protein [Gammaproteobacteria bacterium]|nr:tRNA methyl transferase-like protein [Gammaproteobacteria bacterium]